MNYKKKFKLSANCYNSYLEFCRSGRSSMRPFEYI